MFPTTHKEDLAKIRAAQERVTKGRRVFYEDTPASLELKKYFNDRLTVEENRRNEISDSMMIGRRKRDTSESRELKELYGLNDSPTQTSKFTGIGTSEGISGSSGLIIGNINNTLN